MPDLLACEEIKAEKVFLRSQSSMSDHFKTANSRPSSVSSNRSSNIKRNKALDTEFTLELTAAIKKLSLRTFLNLSRQPVDENSLCLVFAFIMLVGIVDTKGPAGMIKNSKSKVVPAFSFYLKNSGKLIQIIRKIPKSLKNPENSNILKKVQGLMKILDHKKVQNFLEIHDFIQEALNFASSQKEITEIKNPKMPDFSFNPTISSLSKTSSCQAGPSPISTKTFIKKSRNTSSFDLNTKNVQRSSKPKHEKSSSFSGAILKDQSHFQASLKENQEKKQQTKKKVSSGEGLEHGRQNRTEKFLLDSRINKRIQEKLVKFLKDKQIEEDHSKVIQDFVTTLPCSEVNSNTYKLAEIYLNKHCK
jgi:hypothetical protein